MEMLKQFNDSPIPFFKQVVFLYAGINGYLEKVPLSAVGEIRNSLPRCLKKVDMRSMNK